MDLKCTHARSLNDLPPRRSSYRTQVFLIQESFSTPSTALQNKLPNNEMCTAFFSYLVLYYQGTNRLPSPPCLRIPNLHCIIGHGIVIGSRTTTVNEDRVLVDFELGIDKPGKCPAPGQRKICESPVVAGGGLGAAGIDWNALRWKPGLKPPERK